MFPPDLRDWVSENDIVHFIIDAVELIDLQKFRINEKGSGSRQYPPSMMLSLLVYCYVHGTFSSRKIEEATFNNIPVRYICDNKHPDHDTINSFRKDNKELFAEAFLKILAMATKMGKLKKVGSVSIDGTKIHANASKHKAVSYDRAYDIIKQLELEVEELINKAEDADSTPLEDGTTIPDEIIRREDRIEQLKIARDEIEKRFEKERVQKESEYKEKLKDWEDREGKRRGRKPQEPSKSPAGNKQYNFTDSDSAIMKAGNGKHFEQSYNAQAAVDVEGSMLILGNRLTNEPNDKEQLKPSVESVDENIREIDAALVDAGYYAGSAIVEIEKENDIKIYASVGKKTHGRTVEDLEKKDDPEQPTEDAGIKEIMEYRLQTEEGKGIYKLRKQTVEPVFGIIKHVMGFRQFSLRGNKKVSTEWSLVCLAYNFKRLYNMTGRIGLSEKCFN
jgi:transposase